MSSPSLESSIAKPPDREEILEALRRVVASDAFRRSERHARFLTFVCETTLNGNGSQLNEYLIAHEVFGRGPDYSPGEDSVVRRQAHSVRQKLQDYYGGPGKNDPVRIELPVGRYVAVFVRPQAEVPAEVAPVETPRVVVSVPDSRWRGRSVWAAAIVAATGLAFAAGWKVAHLEQGRARTLDPAVGEVWAGWLADGAGATICFSNPLTAVVKQFSSPVADNVVPRRMPMGPAEAEHFRQVLGLPPGGYLYLSPAISQAKMGEAIGSVRLAALFAGQGLPVYTTQSRLLNWDDFRAANLILLGHDEANRWLDPILMKLPMHLAATEGDKPRRILDSLAKEGQSKEYRIQYSTSKDQPSYDYALISMLNGIDGRHQLLLVNGLNTEGTQTALEFLTDPAGAGTLVAALRRAAPEHKGPWLFQAVIRTEVRDKVPTRADLLLVRVL